MAERLPCLATAHPAPAAISAAVVETLNVRRPPPVPAVSSRFSCVLGTCAASSRIVRAMPASSCTVSPLVRSAIRKPAIWVSETSPCMICASTSAACASLRSLRDASVSIALVRIGLGISCEEVAQQLLALFGEHRLGVKLHALSRQLAVAQRHQHAVALGRGLQAGGQLAIDDQRVIAPHYQRRGEAGEDRAAVVLDRGRFAVHGRVQHHAAPERLRERLVAEAHAERGDARLGQPAHRLQRDPRLVGGARPGRDHAALVPAGEQLIDGRAVVAHRVHVGAQLAEVLHEVVGERVVVVDDQVPSSEPPCLSTPNRPVRMPARSRASPPWTSPPTPRTRTPAWRRRRCRRRPGCGRRRP